MSRSNDPNRCIAHVDMDAFYASVEIRDDPSLRGKPVVVGGAPDQRGVVSAASYEARRYGVRSAMPMAEAVRRCPALIRLPVDMARYQSASRRVMEIFARYSPLVEPISLDEAFLDLTGTQRSMGPPAGVARRLKAEIREATALSASVGIAPVKFVAKIASDLEKPDGLVIVPAGGVVAFLDPLPIARLWGVGPKLAEKLLAMGIETIGALARTERRRLERAFGLSGTHVHDLANGLDPRSVTPAHDAKSYSHEMTFARDETDGATLRSVPLDQSANVARRLRRDGVGGRTIVLKLRDHRFRTITRHTSRESATDSADAIHGAVASLFERAWDGRPIRLIGVGVKTILDAPGTAPSLFDAGTAGEVTEPRGRTLDETIDRIESRFGRNAVFRAGTMRARGTRDTGSAFRKDE